MIDHLKRHLRMAALRNWLSILFGALMLPVAFIAPAANAQSSFADVVESVQPKIVKIYGAGGFRKLEAYQSGFLISAQGHVLTAWSYVLDTDEILVTHDDGQKFVYELVGIDPRLEIAVLKPTSPEEDDNGQVSDTASTVSLNFPHFKLKEAVPLVPGSRVLAFSNIFKVAVGDEAASVLHGSVSSKTKLAARSGASQTAYRGPVYILDAMTNNPGAAGGALTDRQGRLAAILGKELRSSLNNTWLNYAIPIKELSSSVEDILAGKTPSTQTDDDSRRLALDAITLSMLGITLTPDILQRTPPFIDRVRRDSPASRLGLRPDDLILFVNDRIASSCKIIKQELTYIDRTDSIHLVIQRGQDLIEIQLKVSD